MTFYDKETRGFNPNVFFSARIEHDYTPGETDKERAYMENVKQRLFYNPIGSRDVEDWFISNIARGLMGEAPKMKQIMFCLGQSNCGKTTFMHCYNKFIRGICWNL